MGARGLLSIALSAFVLTLLALLVPASADTRSASSKMSMAAETVETAETAEEGISSAAVVVASQGTRAWSDEAPPAQELQCLAEGMYYEARGEPWRGQIAVGRVILNRVKSTSYPDTICGVVYQNRHKRNRCQFSFACDGKPDRIAERDVWERVRGYAEWLLANDPKKGGDYQVLASLDAATHYHADYVLPRWAKFFELTARIGRHIFYADPSA